MPWVFFFLCSEASTWYNGICRDVDEIAPTDVHKIKEELKSCDVTSPTAQWQLLSFLKMHILPPSLLDLISARASSSLKQSSRGSTRSNNFLGGLGARGAHQTALATIPSSGDIPHFDQAYTRSIRSVIGFKYPDLFARYRRRVKRRREGPLAVKPSYYGGPSQSLSILEEKVQALQSVVANEVLFCPFTFDKRMVLKCIQEHFQPGLSEDDLVDIYEDLLALPTQELPQQTQQSQAEADHAMMLAIKQRLFDDVPESILSITSPLISTLRSLRAQTSTSSMSNEPAETGHCEGQQHGKPHLTIVIRLKSIIEKLDAVRATVDSGAIQENLPISILSLQEWQSLIRTCVCFESSQ